MNTISEVADFIKARPHNNRQYVIAVSGFGGSGKSTISGRLAEQLGNALVIHVDDFIEADENGAKEGFIHDWMNLEKLVFKEASSASRIVARIYDWPSNKQVHEEAKTTPYILIEGSAGLLQDKYREYFDTTIWLDVPQEEANQRGKKRDKEEYNVNHDELWDNVWSPLEKKTFQQDRPDKKADILFENKKRA